jgi:hypothetical protein
MKHKWSNTFLSFENIYNKEWTLVFMKWWIYYISNYEKYIKEKKIDLNKQKKIVANPIRPFNLEWYEGNIDFFLKYLND